MKKLVALGLTVALAAFSAATAEEETKTPAAEEQRGEAAAEIPLTADNLSEVAGKTFVLREMRLGGELMEVDATPEVTLKFMEEERIGGRSFVNQFGGSLDLDGECATFAENIISTKMAGPPEQMAREDRLFEHVRSTAALKLSREGWPTLTAVNADGEPLLVYAESKAEAVTAANLDKLFLRVWVLEAFRKDGEMVTPPDDLRVTLIFREGPRYYGNSFVNRYHGRVTVADDHAKGKARIALGDRVASTRRAGPIEMMTSESHYFAALRKARKAALRLGDELRLLDSRGELLARYRERPPLRGAEVDDGNTAEQ